MSGWATAVGRVLNLRTPGPGPTPPPPQAPIAGPGSEILSRLAEALEDAIVEVTADGTIRWANAAFARLTGYAPQDHLGVPLAAVLPMSFPFPPSSEDLSEDLAPAGRPPREQWVGIEGRDKSGQVFRAEIRWILPTGDGPEGGSRLAVLRDTTRSAARELELQRLQARFRHQALHDPLTDLPNRRHLEARIQGLGLTEPLAILRIDVQDLRRINEDLGPAAGDRLLLRVARTLREVGRDTGWPARIGGDGFVLLLDPCAGLPEAEAVAQRLRRALGEAIDLDGRSWRPSLAIGIAARDGEPVTARDLMLRAETALELGSAGGQKRVAAYTPAIHQRLTDERAIAGDLRAAIARGEIEAHYQPQVDARTGALAGVEVFARWQHPDRGMLEPAQFLAVAERHGLVGEIDRAVFARGADDLASMIEAGLDIPRLVFNTTAARIQDPDLLASLRAHQLPSCRLCFELAETALVAEESARFAFWLDQLREMGAEIVVDNFGSGEASIIGLMALSPDGLKVDRRLVEPILRSDRCRQLVGAIVEIGHALDITVIAEGVETDGHAACLVGLGADRLQGHAFARPMTADALRTYLASEGRNPAVAGR